MARGQSLPSIGSVRVPRQFKVKAQPSRATETRVECAGEVFDNRMARTQQGPSLYGPHCDARCVGYDALRWRQRRPAVPARPRAEQGYQIALGVTDATLELINKLLAGRRPTKQELVKARESLLGLRATLGSLTTE
jgi:hypothetical protein